MLQLAEPVKQAYAKEVDAVVRSSIESTRSSSD